MASASRPCLAAQKWSATTATPLGTRTTDRTPGTALALVSSSDFTFPPNTGGRATTAVRRPSNCTSMPNRARPVIFSGVSRRLVGFPMSFQSLGSLSCTVFGAGSLAAASASSPYRARLLPAITTPFSVRQSAGLTPNFWAAAATSTARAVAPAWRHRSNSDQVLLEPPVICMPKAVWAYTGAAGACSTRILDQSASSSSATSIGRAVQIPWPISEWAISTVTLSSVPTRRKALGAKGAAGLRSA